MDTDPQITEPEQRLVSPKHRRSNRMVSVALSDGTYVQAKRLDATTMVFEGLVPMPLLSAVQKMLDLGINAGSAVDQLSSMDEASRLGLVDLLRRHAIRAVVNPVVTETDDGQDDHLFVGDLTLNELMDIWNATAMVPMIDPAAAARFRPRAPQPPPADVPPREDVRPSTEQLADPSVEMLHA